MVRAPTVGGASMPHDRQGPREGRHDQGRGRNRGDREHVGDAGVAQRGERFRRETSAGIDVGRMLGEWERNFPGRIESIYAALRDVAPSQLADPALFDFIGLERRREQPGES